MVEAIATLLTTLYGFYNFMFQPLLALGPYIALGAFSASLALIFSLIYWWLLDIEKADEIKSEIKKHQEKMKEARKEEDPDNASNYMQKTMQKNQELMMLNFRPMIATMVFVALIFPWLGSTFAPTVPLEQQGDMFVGEFEYAGQTTEIVVDNSTNPATIGIGEQESEVGGKINIYGIEWRVTNFKESGGGFFSMNEGMVLKLNGIFINLPFSIPLAGNALNWLGYYIVVAMPLTIIFRKLLGVA